MPPNNGIFGVFVNKDCDKIKIKNNKPHENIELLKYYFERISITIKMNTKCKIMN